MPIKEVKFLREDDLARKLRSEESFIEMRCVPIIYKGSNYNLFIEGSILDRDIFKAVSEGQHIDTSDSVNPHTLQSLIIDV